MVGQRSKNHEDVRFRVMRLLHENPKITQRELAEKVEISVGGIHYVLKALVEKGSVKLGNFSAAKDKRRYVYILTPKGIAEKTAITKRFLARKLEEYESLKAEIESLRDEMNDDINIDVRRGK